MSRLESIRFAAEQSMTILASGDSNDTTATVPLYDAQSQPYNCIDWNQLPQNFYRLPPMKELGIHLSNFSITCWVRVDKFARPGVGFDETNTILGQTPYRKDRNLIVGVRQRRLFFSFTDDDTYGKSELRSRQWYHVAFVYDLAARTQSIYLNGKRDGYSENRGPTATTGNLFIGSCENSRRLQGAISELHIYTHALSPHDIRRLIERDSCGYQQVTPNWTSLYNVYDENLPQRPAESITDSFVLTTDAFQSSAPEVKIVNPYPLPSIRSTFLPAAVNGKHQNKSLVACTCCHNAMDLLNSRAALKMNIDYFPHVEFKVVLACYKVSLRYQGPIFRLRRADDDVELDFFSDNEGNLTNQSQTTSFEGWSNGSEAYIVVWYSQTGESSFNATQKNMKKQPKYNATKKLVEFIEDSYLEMNPLTLPEGNGSYTYIVKHGEIHNPRGGLFGVGRGSSPFCGVSLQRLPLHSSYRSYWIDNDHQFTGFQAGNEVFEIYDANKMTRVGGVNGRVTGELHNVPQRDMKVSRAVLGKGLEYQGMTGNYSMNGEMEYFITTYQPMTNQEVTRLYQPGMKIYDNCLACPNCDALFQIDSLRNISHIAIRFNEKCIEELNFCYTRGVSQRQFIKKLSQSITVPFRLNTKMDERIARVVFQQTEEDGLVNIFFVTNTARQSPLYGGAWMYENAEYVTYAYTAPASSGGIAGLLLYPLSKVLASREKGKEKENENNNRSHQSGDEKYKKHSKAIDSKDQGKDSTRSDKFKQQNKVVTGILLRNGKVFKISLKPLPPKPSVWQSLFCCTSNQNAAVATDYTSSSNRIEEMDKRLSLNKRDTVGGDTYHDNVHQQPPSIIEDGHANDHDAAMYEEHEVDHFHHDHEQDDKLHLQHHQEEFHQEADINVNGIAEDVLELTQDESVNEEEGEGPGRNGEARDYHTAETLSTAANVSPSGPPSIEKAGSLSIDVFPDDSPRISNVSSQSQSSATATVPTLTPKPQTHTVAALPPRIPKSSRSTPSSAAPSPLPSLQVPDVPPSPSTSNKRASPVVPLGSKRGSNSPAIPLQPPAHYRASSPAGSVNVSRQNSFLQPPPSPGPASTVVRTSSSAKLMTSRPSSSQLQKQPTPKTSFLAKLSFYSQKSSGGTSSTVPPALSSTANTTSANSVTTIAQICDGMDFVDIAGQDFDDDDDDDYRNKDNKHLPMSTKPELPEDYDDDDEDDEEFYRCHSYLLDSASMGGSTDIHDIVYVGSNTSTGVKMVWLQDEFSGGGNQWMGDSLEETEGEGYIDYFDLATESSTSFFDFGNDRPMSAQMFDMRDSMRFSFSKSEADEDGQQDFRGAQPVGVGFGGEKMRGLRPTAMESSMYLSTK